MIEIDTLYQHYRAPGGGNIPILNGISLQVPSRSITAVVGPSGAGKSTLARCISLLEKPSSGHIRVNGQDLSLLSGKALRHERRAIGTVFQSPTLLQRKTAWQNIALPLHYLGVVPWVIDQRVATLLDAVGLSHKAQAFPAQLSGGQQQRIAIARALALRPTVLLADEATSGLDPTATDTILQLLKQLRDEFGLSIILITHEMDVVRHGADAVAEIREGRITRYGKVRELLAEPDSPLGQQLFPVHPLPSSGQLLLRATYSASQPVTTDWISRVSLQLKVHIAVLGAHIEQLDGQLAGRLQVAVHFNDSRCSLEHLLAQLHLLGIQAEVIAQADRLQEAG